MELVDAPTAPPGAAFAARASGTCLSRGLTAAASGFGQTGLVSDSKELPANRVSFSAAARVLAKSDPVIARLVEETGLPVSGGCSRRISAAWSRPSCTSSWPVERRRLYTAG